MKTKLAEMRNADERLCEELRALVHGRAFLLQKERANHTRVPTRCRPPRLGE